MATSFPPFDPSPAVRGQFLSCEFLDRDQDESFSALELQVAWERILGSTCFQGGRFITAGAVDDADDVQSSAAEWQERTGGSKEGDRPS